MNKNPNEHFGQPHNRQRLSWLQQRVDKPCSASSDTGIHSLKELKVPHFAPEMSLPPGMDEDVDTSSLCTGIRVQVRVLVEGNLLSLYARLGGVPLPLDQ